jgi:formylglycine-generating enzyme required for sulfatase activity
MVGGDPYACVGYRLLTEAEWEYAARGGTTTAYSFGDDSALAPSHAQYSTTSTATVGGRLPNPWGLFDVHGNVWEWVNDGYSWTYYAGSPSQNPPGPIGAPTRVHRGGAWYNDVSRIRSAARDSESPFEVSDGIGFRLTRSAR